MKSSRRVLNLVTADEVRLSYSAYLLKQTGAKISYGLNILQEKGVLEIQIPVVDFA